MSLTCMWHGWSSIAALAVLLGCSVDDEQGPAMDSTDATGETMTAGTANSSGAATGGSSGDSAGSDTAADQGETSDTGACSSTTTVEVSGDAGQLETFDLMLAGSGFDAYEGQTIEVGFTSGMRCGSATAQIACGEFVFSAPDSLEEGIYKGIRLFIDADGLPGCTRGDPTWTFTTSPIFDDLVLEMTADEDLWGGGEAACVPTC